MIEWLVALLFGSWLGAAPPAIPEAAHLGHGDLDRIATAVEGAESSHGRDPLMWKPNLAGPQGPMQVTLAASRDVGNTDRFDLAANRQIGRDYLAALYRRYGNWPDAVAAYNWGPGNLDRWIAAGRPPAAMAAPIQSYIERVLHDFRGAGAEPSAAAPAPPLPTPPVTPPPTIRDPALHRAYERNAAAIKGLTDFIAGDAAAESSFRATLQRVAQRPGYGEFRQVRLADRQRTSPAALREIAEVLLGKLQAENAAIVLVDGRRHRELR